MKVLRYVLTAAAILVVADVFVVSGESQATDSTTVMSQESPTTLHGGNGRPTPPPD